MAIPAGFDYGTSNCSIGVLRGHRVELLAIEDEHTQIPSTLYAPRPQAQLGGTAVDVRALDIDRQSPDALRFGRAALDAYLSNPATGYFVKSPKSFLGAKGLSREMRSRFVGVVAAMMANIKAKAESGLDAAIDRVVLGRPVHFQGTGGRDEDERAVAMLEEAAARAGFSDVAFLFEPMAAAMEYEARLSSEQCVLVLDIGGGTTDCSMVRVGPTRRDRLDRSEDVLGHSGERIGGNDYDQLLALAALMPALGFGDQLVSGLPLPNTYFVDAVSTNDVNAQQRFYARRAHVEIDRFTRESMAPTRVARLRTVQRNRQTYRLVGSAEQAKIALSESESVAMDLDYLESGLTVRAERADLRSSCERLLLHLAGLVDEVVAVAGRSPDVVYLTGGMSGSVIVREFLTRRFPDSNFVDSDHFAAVTEGLAIWANRIYR